MSPTAPLDSTAYASIRPGAQPLTPNGKLDRKALPAPDEASYPRETYEPPQGPFEQTLSALWEDLLGVTRISRHDNFFELGGALAVGHAAALRGRARARGRVRNCESRRFG
jgi:hypothetical protein